MQFDRYRETHTLDDETYNKDLDDWEQRLSTQKAMNANLTDQVHVLKKVRLLSVHAGAAVGAHQPSAVSRFSVSFLVSVRGDMILQVFATEWF